MKPESRKGRTQKKNLTSDDGHVSRTERYTDGSQPGKKLSLTTSTTRAWIETSLEFWMLTEINEPCLLSEFPISYPTSANLQEAHQPLGLEP
jgi:hypothetical protein